MVLNNELLEFLNEHDSSVGIYSIEKIDNDVKSEIEEAFNVEVIDFQENYFIFLDDENVYNVYHKNEFANKWNERTFTQEEYGLLQLQNKLKEDIYNNGITTNRINFYMDTVKFNEVVRFMKENNMYTLDAESYVPNFRVYTGNNCIPHVPVQFLSEIEKFVGEPLIVDLEHRRIGRNDIDKLNVNDKVIITTYGVFGNSEIKGTVIHKEDNSIHVRPYRSKSKYYDIKVLSLCDIKIIANFN